MTTARQAREHTFERVVENQSQAQSDKGRGADASDECLMGDSSADAAAATDVAAAAAVNAAEGGARVFWECPLGVARVCASGCWRRVQGESAVLCAREAAAAVAIAVAVAAAVTIVAVVATVAAVVVVRATIQAAARQGRSAIVRNSLGSPALRQTTLRECRFRFGIEGNTSTAWPGARVCRSTNNATPTREGSTSTDGRWRVPSRRFAYR